MPLYCWDIYCINLFTGPLASLLMSVWSHRQVALLGALLSNIGLICMPFAPNLEYMYVFYGIVTGKGYVFYLFPLVAVFMSTVIQKLVLMVIFTCQCSSLLEFNNISQVDY